MNLEELKRDLESGEYTINGIARKHGTHSNKILSICKNYNFINNCKKQFDSDEDVFGVNLLERVIKVIHECDSHSDLMKILDIDKKYKRRFLKYLSRNGIDINSLYSSKDMRLLKARDNAPERNQFENMVKTKTISEVSSYYKIPEHKVRFWIKEYKIILQPYNGRKLSTNINHPIEYIINVISNNFMSDSIRLLSTSRNAIIRFCKERGIPKPKSRFEEWDIERKEIENRLEEIVLLNKSKSLYDISTEIGISYEVLKKTFNRNGITPTNHSTNKSKSELELLEYLNSIDESFVSKKWRFEGKVYEIDCFSETLKFGVEYCGEYWHNNVDHKPKFEWARKQGIKLITIFHHEWKDPKKRLIIESMLRSKIKKTNNVVFARKTDLKYITSKQAEEFHNNNHISGYTQSSTNIALVNEFGDIVAVMSFSKTRFNKKYDFEITRFSVLREWSVPGAASKLLNHFRKNNQGKSILTYADLRFGEGEVYAKIGFEFLYETPSNYYYFKNGIKYSRHQFQKHKLEKILDNYDANLSETENVLNNGYYKLIDCGNKVYFMDK